MQNYFAHLHQMNVSEHIEHKGAFAYLSWPYAVTQLRLADPTATWEVKRFAGLPYLRSDCGHFVEVAVTVQGVCLSQIHPVLDAKNRPIAEPTSFDINTSIQRCLVKAIALHGLGLSLYAGEDLPQAEKGATAPPTAVGPKRQVSPEQAAKIRTLLEEAGGDLARFLAYFKVAAIEAIPAEDYERVIRSLEKGRRAAA
jgi:Protein of unknown function (DUF1071)